MNDKISTTPITGYLMSYIGADSIKDNFGNSLSGTKITCSDKSTHDIGLIGAYLVHAEIGIQGKTYENPFNALSGEIEISSGNSPLQTKCSKLMSR